MSFTHTPVRHAKFYFPGVSDGPTAELVIFLVDGVLYRVYRHPLEKNSSVFAAMFSIPQGCAAGDAEGTSDENPIRLDGVPAAELEAMLQILYPVDLLALVDIPVQVWLACLGAALRWDMSALKTLAVSSIDKFGSAARLAAARQHGQEQWDSSALDELCARDDPLTAEEISILDANDIADICQVREGVYARLSSIELSQVYPHVEDELRRLRGDTTWYS